MIHQLILFPFRLPIGNYILTPDFISTYKKIDLDEATILWDVIHDPSSTTVEDIKKLVFDRRYTDRRKRYYLQCGPFSSQRNHRSGSGQQQLEERQIVSTMVTATEPTDEEVVGGATNTDVEEDDVSDHIPPAVIDTTPDSRMVNLLRTLRTSNISTSTQRREPLYPDEDFVSLPSLPPQSSSYSMDCPPMLDDMLKVVREIRSQGMDNNRTEIAINTTIIAASSSSAVPTPSVYNIASHHTTTSSIVTPVAPRTIYPKSRDNDYAKFCTEG